MSLKKSQDPAPKFTVLSTLVQFEIPRRERAVHDVKSLIDVSGDLAAARTERDTVAKEDVRSGIDAFRAQFALKKEMEEGKQRALDAFKKEQEARQQAERDKLRSEQAKTARGSHFGFGKDKQNDNDFEM